MATENNNLEIIDREFDPNFLERLQVKVKVRTAVAKALAHNQEKDKKDKKDKKDNGETGFKTFAAITSELFYIKACVNGLKNYDPIAARANAYLATIAYDLYVTRRIIKEEDKRKAAKKLLALFKKKRKKRKKKGVTIDAEEERNHLLVTLNTMLFKTDCMHGTDEVPNGGRKLTMDDFIVTALKFYGVVDADIVTFTAERSFDKKLDIFVDKVIYPFALQCNEKLKLFYECLGSSAYKVKLFSIEEEEIQKFSALANKGHEFRKNRMGVNVEVWITDLFKLMTIYQGVMENVVDPVEVDTENEAKKKNMLNLRKFRGYAELASRQSSAIFSKALESIKKEGLPSPFVEFEFMFEVEIESLFDCFHPKKKNEKSNQVFSDEIRETEETAEQFLVQYLKLGNDHADNSIAFELVLGEYFSKRATEIN